MKKLQRFLRRWWWAFLAGAGALLGIMVAILIPRRKNQLPINSSTPSMPPQPTFTDRARTEVERVRLEGEVEKARIQAAAEAQHVQLDEIETVGETDPAEGRRMLATWLRNNL